MTGGTDRSTPKRNDVGPRFVAMEVEKILLSFYEAIDAASYFAIQMGSDWPVEPLHSTTIAAPLGGIRFRQPLTHDVIIEILHKMDITVEGAEICNLRDNTYFATLRLSGPSGAMDLDARPCDAIALAVRMGAPISVAEDVLARAPEADLSDYEDISDETEDGIKWLRFLEGLDDEDLGEFET